MAHRGETSEQPVLHVYMADHGRILSTRPLGQKVAEHLRRLTREPGDLILDFAGVEVATPPVLQEVVNAVHAIITEGGAEGRIVLAANMNEDLYETLAYVLARSRQAIAYASRDEVELVEGSPQFAETLREAQALRPFFTAPDLADRLKIKPDTATQRLKKLVSAGVAVREQDPYAEHGIRHVYRVATAELAASPRDREPVSG